MSEFGEPPRRELETAEGFVGDAVSWSVNVPNFIDPTRIMVNRGTLERISDIAGFNLHISSEHGETTPRAGYFPFQSAKLANVPHGQLIGPSVPDVRRAITAASEDEIAKGVKPINLFVVYNTPEITERIQHNRPAGTKFDDPVIWAKLYDKLLKQELLGSMELTHKYRKLRMAVAVASTGYALNKFGALPTFGGWAMLGASKSIRRAKAVTENIIIDTVFTDRIDIRNELSEQQLVQAVNSQ